MSLKSEDTECPSVGHLSSHQYHHSFRYRPLDADQGEDIRLITLNPGSVHDPIRCDIFHVPFGLGIQYESLSYTWADEHGDAQLSERIECAYLEETQYRPFMITKNCAAALRRLRNLSGERILWVDAIAIDQSNETERSHQVGLMAQIYSNASQVIAYLGEDPLGFTEPGLWVDDQRRRAALEKLFSRRWVSRIWVIQEVALAQQVLLVMGPESCLLNDALSSRIRARARLYGLRVPGPLAWDPMVNSTREMLHLLDMARHCHSSEPRDKIYGLIGLASESFRAMLNVNYSHSIEEVLTRTAEAIIICQEDLNILAYASLETHIGPSARRLPSWAPDW